jgi:hypothetical protein
MKVCVCVCVCVYVRMFVCMYVCMYVYSQSRLFQKSSFYHKHECFFRDHSVVLSYKMHLRVYVDRYAGVHVYLEG